MDPPSTADCLYCTKCRQDRHMLPLSSCGVLQPTRADRCVADHVTDLVDTTVGDPVCCGQDGTVQEGDLKVILI